MATVAGPLGMLRAATIAAVALAATGCATALRGTREVLLIESEPPGASVLLTSGISCTTPCALELSRRHSYGLEFTKSGYQKLAVAVNSGVTGWGAAGAAGNLAVIGVPIDAFSGAMRSLRPNPVRVVLVARESDP